MEIPDYLPISYLNQYVYCPRRFWLMFVHGEMDVNAVLLDGTYKHQRVHQSGVHWHPDGRQYTAVWVWSDALKIAGVADFVQEYDSDDLIPIEHKRGRMGKYLNDHVQLCAQALCLEERTGKTIDYGEIFYWKNRRRETVRLTDALRDKTLQIIDEVFALLAQDNMPAPIDHPTKCRDCSLEPICLPQEVLQLMKEQS
ncbi:MAG: CRISPR-associated protein Cas4 [Chloroflexi bacterium]|nr:MAG: CRISPR-associated protein Cas4 [Chloroflexota bacterium]